MTAALAVCGHTALASPDPATGTNAGVSGARPLLPILWTVLNDYGGERVLLGSMIDQICGAGLPELVSADQYRDKIQPAARAMLKGKPGDSEGVRKLLAPVANLLKPQREQPRICAANLSGPFSTTWTGWPIEAKDLWGKEADAEIRATMQAWLNASDPTVAYLERVAHAVTARRGLDEAGYRALIEQELIKAGPDFVRALMRQIQSTQAQPPAFTTDSTGFKGIRFLATYKGQKYDFQGTSSGTVIYKNGSTYLGNNYINGKQYVIEIAQDKAAATRRPGAPASQ
ncbi:hypothetical protein AW878_02425 [Bordetella pseudohinzii]|uniref:Uncharacterized protein n=2 Tax=Bordetella pseudohinzii TaxID=1331258 RepID=A0A0J6C9G8_9BORD|nr:hypothetical protein BBN53_11810 [Bordetella pseudohinzii]KMM27668.1 hypothetical protein L540_01325 [Bordetella pseudohinzii]KXA81513.1 hypothetical protein AW877_04000 [Bordetella pseudohinzii]KXA82127.1 hypothetical protein AW878_02425 [Bordetella pseudohinzii]CUI34115.1 Uncharacterised protein [Bordetella pseudohinzii]